MTPASTSAPAAARLNERAERWGELLAFWAVVFFGFVLLFASSWIPAARRLRAIREEERLVQEEISILETENSMLANRLNGLYNDPYYVERVLRREQGFLAAGEKTVKQGWKVPPR